DEVLLDTEERMEKCVEHLSDDYRGIKSGRATPGLVEGIRVEYYGSPTPLKQLANIGAPEPALLVIKPFDPSAISEIEKAIQKSDIGITPMTDGKIIRLPVPSLSEEQRKKYVKLAKDKAEAQRVAIRNVR
ncbi:MAG TPA: ribosome recycling factor, partial [Planctomycetes bacterium]|nr:ribosome recycling factor [Planctomycetota bacterium]